MQPSAHPPFRLPLSLTTSIIVTLAILILIHIATAQTIPDIPVADAPPPTTPHPTPPPSAPLPSPPDALPVVADPLPGEAPSADMPSAAAPPAIGGESGAAGDGDFDHTEEGFGAVIDNSAEPPPPTDLPPPTFPGGGGSAPPPPTVEGSGSSPTSSGGSPASSPTSGGSAPGVPTQDAECVRDVTIPTPVLGSSAIHYAFAIVGVAACIASASKLYDLAVDWKTQNPDSLLRFAFVFAARVLLILAVKVSAALVAVITNSEGDDAALDASGTFLTWASAILTRVYHEGFRMTFMVLGEEKGKWGGELWEFLRGRKEVGLLDKEGGGEVEGFEETFEADVEIVHERSFGARVIRLLLSLHAFLYVAVETSILVLALLQLVGYLERRNALRFVDPGDAGQCKVNLLAEPALLGLIILQVVFVCTHQNSLVPLLILCTSKRSSKRGINYTIRPKFYRIFTLALLLIWVASYACMPLFQSTVTPIFLAGDLTLFTYIFIAPPSFQSISYIIQLTYATATLLLGVFITWTLPKDLGKTKT